uniref:Uncharacterized protein n=1 Tax=Rousettus aegyptiacus TaxID=9407 RepID=A0A7J8KAW8_ROUAE|nr:hypothetical protein HJG63_007883 [Rousettus aegyptiacus]
MINDIKHFFICLLDISMSSLEKCPFRSSAHFELDYFLGSDVRLNVCFNPLLDVSLENIFSHSVGCLFILLMISFGVQKFFSLMVFLLFTSSFVSLAQGAISEKILLRAIFSSRYFMHLGLTFNLF